MTGLAKNTLEKILKAEIQTHGPLNIQTYWTLCLCHPEHGYYMKQDPFGRQGDFITAPEVSQMFGELIGIWVADLWLKMGSPPHIHLVEFGAGRGTMMSDILRATKSLSGFHQSASIHIVEISHALRHIQRETLSGYQNTWHDDISSIPSDGPIIIIGNEFLDALPIRQIIRAGSSWYERVVAIDDKDKLVFAKGNVIPMADEIDAPENSIFEFSPGRDAVWSEIAARVKGQGGAALMIDYGHTSSSLGNTLQAVRAHTFAPVLENPGEADLTSHVDFARLAMLAKDLQPRVTTQRNFLENLGIDLRVKTLLKSATTEQADNIHSARERLTSSRQMGELFKVIAITSSVQPAGF